MNASLGPGGAAEAGGLQLLTGVGQSSSFWWTAAAGGLAVLALWRVLRPVLRRTGPALLARYDSRVQRAPQPMSAVRAQTLLHSHGAQQLLGWCLDGAGDCAAPWWRPGQRPQVERRLSVAVVHRIGGMGSAGTGELSASASAYTQAVALHLDGSLRLMAAGGRWAGMWLRLRVKGADACWWRPRQNSDPWDAGYLLDQPDTPANLGVWLPRRASLLLAEGLAADQVLACLQVLAARRAGFDHPVRLLVVVNADTAALAAVQSSALRFAALRRGVLFNEIAAGTG